MGGERLNIPDMYKSIRERVKVNFKLEHLFVTIIIRRNWRLAKRIRKYIPPGIEERISAVPELDSMFQSYLVMYLIQKKGYNWSYLSRYPMVERREKLGFIGGIYSVPEFVVKMNDAAVATLKNELSRLRREFPNETDKFYQLQLAANMITTYYLEYNSNKKREGIEELKGKIEDYFRRYPIE